MSILEALKAVSGYPVPDTAINDICAARKTDPQAVFDPTSSVERPFSLLSADVYAWVAKNPSIKQGEDTVSVPEADIEYFKLSADGIYKEYGEKLVFGSVFGPRRA